MLYENSLFEIYDAFKSLKAEIFCVYLNTISTIKEKFLGFAFVQAETSKIVRLDQTFVYFFTFGNIISFGPLLLSEYVLNTQKISYAAKYFL